MQFVKPYSLPMQEEFVAKLFLCSFVPIMLQVFLVFLKRVECNKLFVCTSINSDMV